MTLVVHFHDYGRKGKKPYPEIKSQVRSSEHTFDGGWMDEYIATGFGSNTIVEDIHIVVIIEMFIFTYIYTINYIYIYIQCKYIYTQSCYLKSSKTNPLSS